MIKFNRLITSKYPIRHIIHLITLTALIRHIIVNFNRMQMSPDFNPWIEYGFFFTAYLYFARYTIILTLPQVLFHFGGLVFFNTFPSPVKLNKSPIFVPFICFRVVTRGDFPSLIKENLQRNLDICETVGLINYTFEIATDKSLSLENNKRVKETVIPKSYQTKTGAMFKARALQYCLEDNINVLDDNDWIVHLDEETLLTENCVRGIMNFVSEGTSQFGQGLITYANDKIVNWFTTLADSIRVTDDMGKLRFQFKTFKKPLLNWKGSYVVSLVSAERDISFDHGPDGSIAEDCYFGMVGITKGYKYSFIEGAMLEKSPFTIMDFVQQRKRWFQGIYLVVFSKAIPWRSKIFLSLSFFAWLLMPISTSNIILAPMYPIPNPLIFDYTVATVVAFYIYMYFFGIVKSYSVYDFGLKRCITFCLLYILVLPFNAIAENIAVIWGTCTSKHKFYIVNKEQTSTHIIV